jgi:hypothetical protein
VLIGKGAVIVSQIEVGWEREKSDIFEVPATQEAEIGGSLEPRNPKPAWTT